MDQDAKNLREQYNEMTSQLTPSGRKPNTPLTNVRYERFCHEVAAGRPMHEAAVMARILKAEGKNLKANARRLALRPEVRERIAELAAQAAELAAIHGGWVLEMLARQARASLADLMTRDETGKIVTDSRGEPKFDFRNASPDALANIREIKRTKFGPQPVLVDSQVALDRLGRYLGLWTGDAVAVASVSTNAVTRIERVIVSPPDAENTEG